jgi:enoyl-CoA hydratase
MAEACDYSDLKTLEITREGRLMIVALNRPERLNAIGDGLHEHLEDFFYRVAKDHTVGAIVLTGNGRAFCAGGDVKSFASNSSTPADGAAPPPFQPTTSPILSPKRLIMNMLDVEQPIIGAINGPAMGLGATLALFTDITIMADEAFVADTHVAVGLVAGDGGTVAWPSLLPINRAKYYLLTGERVAGQDAYRLGLVNESVPLAQLMTRAREIARKLADGPTWAIRLTKTNVNRILREQVQNTLDASLVSEMWTMRTDHHREASAAWVERRAPDFAHR